ncbi:heavy-metal-associated domain-containing protein [Flavobacterium sp. 25HG05S-40]|uniref:heavy-metal-associated domain-containing protein n=1 Tax=Flavobacterium sp. 25HG05S-40 TaxID=3458682 RepID=UPI00404507B9
MNFSKLLLTVGIASTLLISCKDTASQPKAENNEAKTEKEVVAAAKPETANFKIDGMTCAMGCAKTIETKLSKMEGVQKATVDFEKKEATVDFDAAVLTKEQIAKTVENTGDGETYKASEIKAKG